MFFVIIISLPRVKTPRGRGESGLWVCSGAPGPRVCARACGSARLSSVRGRAVNCAGGEAVNCTGVVRAVHHTGAGHTHTHLVLVANGTTTPCTHKRARVQSLQLVLCVGEEALAVICTEGTGVQ